MNPYLTEMLTEPGMSWRRWVGGLGPWWHMLKYFKELRLKWTGFVSCDPGRQKQGQWMEVTKEAFISITVNLLETSGRLKLDLIPFHAYSTSTEPHHMGQPRSSSFQEFYWRVLEKKPILRSWYLFIDPSVWDLLKITMSASSETQGRPSFKI